MLRMSNYHLWGTIRQPAGLDVLIITVTAVREPLGGEVRVEQFWAATIGEAEAIRNNTLQAWGYEIRTRGEDFIVDVIDD